MREPKSYLLIIVSVFLLIAAGLLVSTIYLFFQSNKNAAVVYVPANSPVNTTRDSLQKIYTATVSELNDAFIPVAASMVNTADSINQSEAKIINSYQQLKDDVATLLNNKSNAADMEMAQLKISELQLLVTILKKQNQQIAKEKEEMYALLKNMGDKKMAERLPVKEDNAGREDKAINITLLEASIGAASSSDQLQKPTNKAAETDQLKGAIVIENRGNTNGITEVVMVVTQPDTKILRLSDWESGLFNRNGKNQWFTKKLRFNPGTGTPEKISYTISAEKYFAGKYTIQFYQGGSLLGGTSILLL
ncbi:MAG: hypothetical protein RL172_1398 [Bacteroidota bacterium]|jgi:hypothetical protein